MGHYFTLWGWHGPGKSFWRNGPGNMDRRTAHRFEEPAAFPAFAYSYSFSKLFDRGHVKSRDYRYASSYTCSYGNRIGNSSLYAPGGSNPGRIVCLYVAGCHPSQCGGIWIRLFKDHRYDKSGDLDEPV